MTLLTEQRDYESLRIENEQLRHALQSRIVIEQAKGVIAERLTISMDEAFTILRHAARSHRLKLHRLCEDVVRERTTPAPVAASIARHKHAAQYSGSRALRRR